MSDSYQQLTTLCAMNRSRYSTIPCLIMLQHPEQYIYFTRGLFNWHQTRGREQIPRELDHSTITKKYSFMAAPGRVIIPLSSSVHGDRPTAPCRATESGQVWFRPCITPPFSNPVIQLATPMHDLLSSCWALDCFPYSVAYAEHHAQRQQAHTERRICITWQKLNINLNNFSCIE